MTTVVNSQTWNNHKQRRQPCHHQHQLLPIPIGSSDSTMGTKIWKTPFIPIGGKTQSFHRGELLERFSWVAFTFLCPSCLDTWWSTRLSMEPNPPFRIELKILVVLLVVLMCLRQRLEPEDGEVVSIWRRATRRPRTWIESIWSDSWKSRENSKKSESERQPLLQQLERNKAGMSFFDIPIFAGMAEAVGRREEMGTRNHITLCTSKEKHLPIELLQNQPIEKWCNRHEF